jgi:hypothetical protein
MGKEILRFSEKILRRNSAIGKEILRKKFSDGLQEIRSHWGNSECARAALTIID